MQFPCQDLCTQRIPAMQRNRLDISPSRDYTHYMLKEQAMKEPLSIHPRNWPTTGNGKKKNTCTPVNPTRKARAVQGIKAHLERHPNDVMSQARLTKLS